MKNKWIIGNWKMNGTTQSINELVDGLVSSVKVPASVRVGVCPTFVHLGSVGALLNQAGAQMKLGAQDVSLHQDGAYTGQVSANQLKDIGCELVLVGHSERRHGCHETPDEVASKAQAAQKSCLQPVVCLGETLEERESGQMESVLKAQLEPVLKLGFECVNKLIFAYEPVWAIGTGKTASPEQAQEVHAWIRKELAKDPQIVAQSVPILYGGSMKPSNALELLSCPDIDGGLIGGASLEASAFAEICEAGAKASS